jgi:hypothetical protein
MRRYHAFRPSALSLESRCLLSTGVSPRVAALRVHSAAVAAGPRGSRGRIEQSFNSFRTDYFQAQQNFLVDSNTSAGQAAFLAFTTQRVYQLSQELGASLGRVAVGTSKDSSITSLRVFLNNRFLAPKSPVSLLGGLSSATPPVGTTTAGSQLYSLAANSAINAAETASTNSIGSLDSGAFTGNSHLYSK